MSACMMRSSTKRRYACCPQMDFPQAPASHRLLNVHQNVPGVLRDINAIISDLNANIKAQVGGPCCCDSTALLQSG